MAAHGSDGSSPCGTPSAHNQTTQIKIKMKKFLFTLTLAGALALGGQSAFAQAKKKAAAEPAAAAEKPKAADTAKPKAEGDAKKADKPIPMYVRADEIDTKAKTITQNNKDGKKAVNSVTATTAIMNGDKAAKLEDIKVGDYVSGNRMKTGENTYDLVKITKFGAKAPKAEGEAKKPAAEAKKPAAEPKKK